MKRYISAASQDVEDEEIFIPEQEFTSEKTSINSTKLPAVFKLVTFAPNTTNLDYGGGRFDNAAEALAPARVTNLVYDPYNRTAKHNNEVLKTIRSKGGADTATCSNVLNVIKEPEARLAVLKNIKKLLKPNGTAYITVYEGNGSGEGKPTKSGYQRNMKTSQYLEEIQEVFPDARCKGKLIIANKSDNVNSASTIAPHKDYKTAIEEAIKQWTISAGYDDTWANDYATVEVYEIDSTHTKVEVRAELDFDECMELASVLNAQINKLDPDAYFDMEDAGIMSAILEVPYTVLAATNCCGIMAKPIISSNDPDEDDDWEEADPFQETLDIDIDADVYVDKYGSYDYGSSKCTWAAGKGTNGDWYSEDYNVRITDSSGLIENIDDLIESRIPAVEGTYHVKGQVSIVYDISGVYVKRDYFFDEDHGSDYVDDDVDTSNAKVEFNISDSTISSLDVTSV